MRVPGWDEPKLSFDASSVASKATSSRKAGVPTLPPTRKRSPEREIFMFCPECAEREFGPSGWEDNALD
jgi:hypothetical protein